MTMNRIANFHKKKLKKTKYENTLKEKKQQQCFKNSLG